MPIEVVQGDITRLAVDAIVNPANEMLLGGGGADGDIHRAAGRELFEACFHLGGCRPGHAKITPGFRLPARHVIHTVGPRYYNCTPTEAAELLASCYRECLDLAVANGCQSIAFPCISTGAFGYPPDAACAIALDGVRGWVRDAGGLSRIVFCCYTSDDFDRYQRLFG